MSAYARAATTPPRMSMARRLSICTTPRRGLVAEDRKPVFLSGHDCRVASDAGKRLCLIQGVMHEERGERGAYDDRNDLQFMDQECPRFRLLVGAALSRPGASSQ